MSKFEVYDESVQYHDDDGDVLEIVSASDSGVLLTSGQDGTWVDSKDLAEVVRHMANLSDVDGEFIEASGHEVETLWQSYGCGVGESRVLVNTDTKSAKPEIVEEVARNLWAIAKVMREEEEAKEALPELGTYVTLAKGTATTYGFPVIFDEDTNIFVVATSAVSRKVSVSGTASGKRRVYTVHPEAVNIVRPKATVGDRVTVAANAATCMGEPTHFGGETTGTITAIHDLDATVRGYSHKDKGFIEQQVALDFLTPAEEPKVGDRVFVDRYARTTAGSAVYFNYAVEGVVLDIPSNGMFVGDLHIQTKDPRARYEKQYVAPKWVVVLPSEAPEVGDRVLVLKDTTSVFGGTTGYGRDVVATVVGVNFRSGNLIVRTLDPHIHPDARDALVDLKKVTVLEKAADIAAARAEVLKNGTVKFEDLPEELQKFVDAEIERKKKK